jgi:inositol phosphorylceramide mannosyltransferase catalytic subunit
MIVTIPESLKKELPHKFDVKIPRIIHQTYISIEKLPEVWKDTPESWKQHNPDWQYMFWSDEDCRKLVEKEFPDFLPIFDAYPYAIQRADAIRPILMYVYGGVYADCDIACKKPIDDLFYKDHDCYLIHQSSGLEIITNCLIASKPKVPFWLAIIDEMVARFHNPSMLWIGKHLIVEQTTGPMLYQAVYDEFPGKSDIGILPKEFVLPSVCNICSEKPCTTKESYTVMLRGESWCEGDSAFYNVMSCNYHYLLMFFAVSLVTFVFYIYGMERK